MTEDFQRQMASSHQQLTRDFAEYRDQIAQVLFFGERIARSELQEGIESVVDDLENHIDAVQRIVLPALSSEQAGLEAVDVLADFQDDIRNQLHRTRDEIERFADPDRAKDERNKAAREALKDLYRLDGLLEPYFDLVEKHFLTQSNGRLDEDEQDQLLNSVS